MEDKGFAFVGTEKVEFVTGYTPKIPSDIEFAGLKMEISKPELILNLILMGFQAIGVEDKQELPGLDDIGDESVGVTFNTTWNEAKLQVDQTNLDKAIIVSPINGVVLARSVEPGQTVAASLQAPVLFTLAEDLTKMELHVAVDEADVGQVRDGQQATFTVDAYPDRVFPARITQVRYGSQRKLFCHVIGKKNS